MPFGGRILAFLATAALVLCARSGAKEIWWTERLQLSDLGNIEQRLRVPFEEVVTVSKAGSQARIGNCIEYKERHEGGYKADSDRQLRALQYEGVDCAALFCLQRARPSQTSYIESFHLDRDALSQLPPNLAVAVSRLELQRETAAERRGLSWLAYQPGLTTQTKGESLITIGDGMRTVLTIYARADFNNDYVEDLLLRQDYAAEQGTYSGSRLFLLTRSAPNKILKVLQRYE